MSDDSGKNLNEPLVSENEDAYAMGGEGGRRQRTASSASADKGPNPFAGSPENDSYQGSDVGGGPGAYAGGGPEGPGAFYISDAGGPTATGRPLYGEGAPQLQTKFVVQGCQDWYFAVAFAVLFFIIFILGCVAFSKHQISIDQFNHSIHLGTTNGKLVGALFGVILLSSLLAFGSMILFHVFPSKSIVVGAAFTVSLTLIMGIVAFVKHSYAGGVFAFIFAIIIALYILFGRARILFSALLLRSSTDIVLQYKWGLLATHGITLFIFFFLTVFWAAAIYPPAQRRNNGIGNGGDVVLIMYALLVYFWLAQIVLNVMSTTVAGLTATYYFVGGEANMPRNPTLASYRRACTTSFGSIAFGSLLVAFVRLIRSFIEEKQSDTGAFMACLSNALLGMIERAMKYFNQYAFTYCAIYGMGYIDAANQTFELAKGSFCSALFNDSLIGWVLTSTSISISALLFIIFWLTMSAGVGVIMMLISYVVTQLVFRYVDSASTTLFICYVEEPQGLAQCDPDLYSEVENSRRSASE